MKYTASERRNNMENINIEIAQDIMAMLPEEKKQTLARALFRNEMLTSTWVLEHCTIVIYREGWLLDFSGTRSGFKVFAKDNDGDMEIIRKPIESKLHEIYRVHIQSYRITDFEEYREYLA